MKTTLYRNIAIFVYVLLLPLVGFAQRAGDLDITFNPGTAVNGWFNTTAVQSDGKIIIGGYFSSYNGTSRNNISRLNADGSLDPSFNSGAVANRDISDLRMVSVDDIAVQADGKIIIGGYFTSYNGTPLNHIARLNADGSLDATFNPGTGANEWVGNITLQTDGKIIIGGWFTSFNGTSRSGMARLNADGSLDETFNPGIGVNNTVWTTAVQADGKIIIGGFFTYYNGTPLNHIARLNADGSLDATFNPGTGASSTVYTTALQADGKIIIGGAFTSYNGTNRNRIARLNTDGSLDATFNPGRGARKRRAFLLKGYVQTTTIQADGKIIIGGEFNSYNGSYRNRIARLNADGSLDETFNPGTGVNNTVRTTALQADGKIIIGGYFTSYNGTTINRIARLNANVR